MQLIDLTNFHPASLAPLKSTLKDNIRLLNERDDKD
jgi:hypothetical protein